MNTDSKRGQNAALAGLVLQAALAGVFCAVWLLTDTLAAKGVFLLNVAGLAVWIICAALFYCRRLAELESQELADMAESRGGALFDAEGGPIPLAQRRLAMIKRWLAPLLALLLGLALLATGGWLGRPLVAVFPTPPAIPSALMWAFFCLGASFLGFLFSRYAVGMARTPRWRLLRAGGGFMTLGIFTGALLCGAFFLEHMKMQWGLQVLPYINAALMLVLGIELLANFILDFYRPRKPDIEPRPSFDSRLASLLSEPGGIAHSIAEAMNYQFGFEVSSTWFYQLLRKALIPLMLFGLLALIAISAVVVVEPGQEAVVLTFGAAADGSPKLTQGISLKWPWPIQTVDIVDIDLMRSFTIGITKTDDDGYEEDEHDHARPKVKAGSKLRTELIIWTREHEGHEEIDFLTARERSQAADEADSFGAFGLIRFVFSVDYHVKDVYRFRYGVDDAEQVLRGLAMREATLYTAERDVDSLLQRGGGDAAKDLRKAINDAATQLALGVEVITVNVRGVHPLPKVADAFEEVIKAEQEGKGTVLSARISADSLLSTVAGSKATAEALMGTFAQAQQLQEQGAPAEQIASVEQTAIDLLDRSRGQAKVRINEARADRWAAENAGHGRLIELQGKLPAFRAAPRLYALQDKLKVLSETLKDAPKWILGVDRQFVEIRYQDERRVVGGGATLGSQN